MNYTNMIYKSIGNRVKHYRARATVIDVNKKVIPATLDNIDMDNAVLSRIQNGIALKRKNPYLFNMCQAEQLCNLFNIDKKVLIWGTVEERENMVKLLLLAILMNGATLNGCTYNPFCYYESNLELFRWAKKQKIFRNNLDNYLEGAKNLYENNLVTSDNDEINVENFPIITIKELRERVESACRLHFGFFYSKDNFDAYELLNPKYDKCLVNLSDELFKQLLHNYEFTKSFIEHSTNLISFQDFKNISSISEVKHVPILINAENLLLHPSKFILVALDYKEYDFCNFVCAFNKLWDENKDIYMNYFNSEIFNNLKLNESGLKAFQNKDIDSIIKSDTFLNLCNKTSIMEEYTNPQAILAKNYFIFSVQKTIEQNYIDKKQSIGENCDNTLFEYLINSFTNTIECANKIL